MHRTSLIFTRIFVFVIFCLTATAGIGCVSAPTITSNPIKYAGKITFNMEENYQVFHKRLSEKLRDSLYGSVEGCIYPDLKYGTIVIEQYHPGLLIELRSSSDNNTGVVINYMYGYGGPPFTWKSRAEQIKEWAEGQEPIPSK